MVDDLGTSQVELELFGAGLDIGLVAQDGQLGNLIAQHHVCGLEDTVIVTLRQNDVRTGGAGLVNELLLEEVCGHDRLDIEVNLAGQRLAVLEMVWGDNAGDGRLHVLGVADREFGRALFLLGYEQQRYADGGGSYGVEVGVAGALNNYGAVGGKFRSDDVGELRVELIQSAQLRV